MECRRAIQVVGVLFCVLLVVAEIYSLPAYSNEDYDQGVREMMEELERQGLTGPMVARAYHANPSHNMMRKSQRSNNLRLRFGKRSVLPYNSPANTKDADNHLYWKDWARTVATADAWNGRLVTWTAIYGADASIA